MTVAAYARVSTRLQQEHGVEVQLERLCGYEAQHWRVAEERVFRDDGYGGAHLSRLGLAALCSSAASGEMTHLLVTAPERLARNYSHPMLLLEALDRAGCEVVFLERPMIRMTNGGCRSVGRWQNTNAV